MLMLPDHWVIPLARRITYMCVEEITQAGEIQVLACDQQRLVNQFAKQLFAEYLTERSITMSMIECWVLEAIAVQPQIL